MKFLHFTDNRTIDTNNHPQPGLRKIYELFDALNRKFKSSYIPECEVSVDESLLLYKGLLASKQYIPNKKSKFGVKCYQLREARSGMEWKFPFNGTKADFGYAVPKPVVDIFLTV
ncbi:hypothetical protein AVEN_73513-1 [Araneus ventricosus]|uniref:PiggyBac transposable element-derived protein domain-containing protein n=1 Tax=Araneus ventricosus TaxID=182803 RepID=A0A4Y2IRS2_ARAVE|nr:hypothetical protein AVEN_73513-1 [Araneus ventricosus]